MLLSSQNWSICIQTVSGWRQPISSVVQANGLAILSRLTSGKGITNAVWVLCDEEVVSCGVSIMIPDTISSPACLDFLEVLQGKSPEFKSTLDIFTTSFISSKLSKRLRTTEISIKLWLLLFAFAADRHQLIIEPLFFQTWSVHLPSLPH